MNVNDSFFVCMFAVCVGDAIFIVVVVVVVVSE